MATAQDSAAKYANRASAASGDYVDGASRTSKDPIALAKAAEKNYNQGVQDAVARGAFAKGLSKVSKADWQKGVTEKGASRYSGGVTAAQEKYARNSGVYDSARNAAASLPRGPRGSEGNYQRSTTVGKALRAVKAGK